MVQVGSRTNVAQKHVVDLRGEVFLGDGVILQQTTSTWSDTHQCSVQTNTLN